MKLVFFILLFFFSKSIISQVVSGTEVTLKPSVVSPGVVASDYINDLPMNYPFCGRLSAIAINTFSAQHIVVASESGGLFETKNAGTSSRKWTHINDFKESNINDLLMTNVAGGVDLYAVTSNSFKYTSKPQIWKRSVDNIWRNVEFIASTNISFNKSNVYRIIQKSPGSKILYACGDFGLAYSDESGMWRIKPGPESRGINSIAVMKDGSIICGNASGLYRVASIEDSWALVSGAAKIPTSAERFALKTDLQQSTIVVATMTGATIKIYASTDMGIGWSPFRIDILDGGAGAGGLLSIYPDYDVYNKKMVVYVSNKFEIKYASASGNTNEEALMNLQRNTLLTWSGEINNGHVDTRQIAFLRQGVYPEKMIITSDGGLHIANIKSDGVVKNYDWVTENTSTGLKATQIYNVMGHEGSFYFGTQDNGFGASVDGGRTYTCGIGGEGSVIPMYGIGTNTTNQTIVLPTVDVYPDKKIFGIGTTNGIRWNMPSAGWGCPIFLSGSTYIQDARPPEGSLLQPWKISYNNGTTWNDIAAANYVRYGNLRHGFGLAERRATIGGDNYSLYITMNGVGKKILGRLNNVSGTPNNWTYPSLTGLNGGVGIFGTQFMWDAVFAVNPSNASHLLAVEQETGKLKVSNNGGDSWSELHSFTTVFNTSRTQFKNSGNGLNNNAITSISFCPYNSNKILVGTVSQGVFYTKDGGVNWKKLNDPGVFMPTAFYWPSQNKVYMSTYGRGMFSINLN